MKRTTLVSLVLLASFVAVVLAGCTLGQFADKRLKDDVSVCRWTAAVEADEANYAIAQAATMPAEQKAALLEARCKLAAKRLAKIAAQLEPVYDWMAGKNSQPTSQPASGG